MKWTIILGILVIVLTFTFFALDIPYSHTVTTFEECVGFGYEVRGVFPRECTGSDGTLYTEKVSTNASSSLAVLDEPREHTSHKGNISLSGKARGYWFDGTGTLAVLLEDETGVLLATSTVSATGDFATYAFVPFVGSISFSVTTTTQAFLVIPEHEGSGGTLQVRIPLTLLKK